MKPDLSHPPCRQGRTNVCEGWWHPNVKSGQVHDHPEHPGRSWQTAMHRQCEQIYTKRASNAELVEARAAAPQPLWRGETKRARGYGPHLSQLPIRQVSVPPGTEVAVYKTDETPAGVTREQVDSVVFQWFGSVIADWMAVNGLEVTEGESFRAQDQLVDQLMALLRGKAS